MKYSKNSLLCWLCLQYIDVFFSFQGIWDDEIELTRSASSFLGWKSVCIWSVSRWVYMRMMRSAWTWSGPSIRASSSSPPAWTRQREPLHRWRRPAVSESHEWEERDRKEAEREMFCVMCSGQRSEWRLVMFSQRSSACSPRDGETTGEQRTGLFSIPFDYVYISLLFLSRFFFLFILNSRN